MLNILIAFPYFKPDLVRKLESWDHSKFRLIVDSGAFTAWNTGKTILMDDYCRFLDSIRNLRPFNAVQLDVFGNPEKTYENFLHMMERKYDVMPVFTRGDTLERLNEFYEKTDYIMFGGIVTGGKNKNYVKWFLNNNQGRKCHWLGFVNMPFIKTFRPESVDSSSWCGTGRFGQMFLYNGSGEVATFKRQDVIEKRNSIEKQLRMIGLSPSEIEPLKYEASWRGWQIRPIDFKSPQKGFAQFISTLAHVKRMVEVERRIGTKIYLAVGNEIQLDLIKYCYDFLKERGSI